ncbi:MAG: hypothetical protein ACI8Z5_000879 [Lentimonas sp.]|jgi:hypothetical protein
MDDAADFTFVGELELTALATTADANKVELGSKEFANERVIYQQIHQGGIQSCQLVMGYTVDPVHFGIIMIANLGIERLTPPVGTCLCRRWGGWLRHCACITRDAAVLCDGGGTVTSY